MFSRTFLAEESRHLLFYKKKGWFFSAKEKQKDQPFKNFLNTKVFCLLFFKKVGACIIYEEKAEKPSLILQKP